MSPGSKESADDSTLVRSGRLLETYDTSPSANMMMPTVSKNVVNMIPLPLSASLPHALSCRQRIEFGANCIHSGFDDGTNTWNPKHPIEKMIEVGFDGGKCVNDSLAGVGR